jgi:replicative DNA helicase
MMPPDKKMATQGHNGPGKATITAPALTKPSTTKKCTGDNRQIPPIGPHPGADVLLIGSLLWSRSGESGAVLALVSDDDIANQTVAAVLAAIRALTGAGKACGPQLVLDELRRTGALNSQAAEQLRLATTCGACSDAAREYAAAVVAESLRRHVESAGHALVSAADDAAEADLTPLVTRATGAVLNCLERLRLLRGES